MLKWEKIYELNDNNNKKAGTVFEKLVLKYLSCVYCKYSWKNTQSSWDNNRDFISLVLDNIWGEAKYKKNSSSLEKKDVDPTMISGFLNGKIELVFIITNGQIPSTISSRINEIGKKCGFTVICITQTQLEYWLIAHPKQYSTFFAEALPNVSQLEAVSIENIRLENQLEANYESSYIQPEFMVNSICNLCITFSCNTDLECFIVDKGEYPFQFIEPPKILLSPGIQQKCIPVKLTCVNNSPIVLKFMKTDGTILSYVLDIKIINSQNPELIYSQQELIKIDICCSINSLPNTSDNHIINIQGATGYGKTYLMREMAKDLSFFHVVAVLQCESRDFPYLNSIKLCQMIMYFNYGEIYQNTEDYDEETKKYYKYLIIKNNYNNIIENDLLIDIFEGCFDRLIAQKVIKKLNNNKPAIIKKTEFARRHILFLDNVHYFSEEEINVFNMIVHQLKCSRNSSILIFSSETNLFDKSEIIPNKLEGLSVSDIAESLKYNLTTWQYNTFSSMIGKMPKYPKMICELIAFIKNNSNDKLSVLNANQYITKLNNNKLSNLKFDLTNEEKVIIDLIFNFPKGIDEKLLHVIELDEILLKHLCDKGYILYFKQRYMPCVDYFQRTYMNNHGHISSKKKLFEYVRKLLDNSCIDPLFDIIQAQTLLIQCDSKLYLEIKEKNKNKMIEYIMEGNYKAAMSYGEIFCFDIINNEKYYQEINFDELFYYGIALIHCDSQRRAMDIFTYIKNHSKQNTISYFRASAELLNNRYSRFQIDGILSEAIVLKRNIYIALYEDQVENSPKTQQLRIAYSTCMNRIMMIYFLKDNCEKASEIYDEFCRYHLTLPHCTFSDKYESMLQEWKMDYARGLAVYDLQNSINLDKECYSRLSENIDFRRKVLCKIDIVFFEAIKNRDYDNAIRILGECKYDLTAKGIVSEDMKTTIRITHCRLMKYLCIPEFDDISLLAPFVDEIYAEVFSTQLETHLIAQGRTAYMLNNLLAILHIIKDDINTAAEIIQHNMNLIKNCGEKYRQIAEHNYHHLNDVKKVDWYFYKNVMYDDTYYLDLRVW